MKQAMIPSTLDQRLQEQSHTKLFDIYSLDSAHHYFLALVRNIQTQLEVLFLPGNNQRSAPLNMNRQMMMNLNPDLLTTTKHTWNYFANV